MDKDKEEKREYDFEDFEELTNPEAHITMHELVFGEKEE